MDLKLSLEKNKAVNVFYNKSIVSWTINDFSLFKKELDNKLNSIISQPISVNCYLKVFPFGPGGDKSSDFVSVYFNLNSINAFAGTNQAIFELGLLNKNLQFEMFHHKLYYHETGPIQYGFDKFISRKELFDNAEKYLPNDSLTIVCKIRLFRSLFDKKLLSIIIPDNKQNTINNKLINEMKLDEIVSLVIGDEKINIYKNILTSSSPVFASMFSDENTKENYQNIIEIKDMNVDICKKLVMYLNTGEMEFDITYDGLISLLKAADKYHLERLKALCERGLFSKMNNDNSVDVYTQACLYNALQLKKLILDFFRINIDKVIDTAPYETLKKDYPQLCIQILEHIVKNNNNIKYYQPIANISN